jgi:long-chain acyl-CoA synthetase
MEIETKKFVLEQLNLLNPKGHASLVEAFLDSCREHADEVALKCMGHPMTYSQLEGASRAFASYLKSVTDLSPGDRIAIQLPNIPQYPIAAWGALRAGLVLVNTNPMYTPRELKHQLEDSGARAIVILESLLPVHEQVIEASAVDWIISVNPAELAMPEATANADAKALVGFAAALALGAREPFEDSPGAMSDIAVLQYTGGTTGVAKGAILTQGNLYAAGKISSASYPVELEDGQREMVIAPMPFYHVYGFAINLIGMPLKGGTLVLIPDPRNIDSLIQVMKAEPYTGMTSVNTLLIALMQHPEFGEIDFSTVFGTIAGGAPLVKEVAVEWERRTGTRVYEGYGLSETSATGAVNNVHHYRLGSIGRCVLHTEAKLVGDDGERPEPGEPGELLIRGPQVMQGYWQNPEGTESAFDDEGWFRTGDIATIDEDRFIRIVDRKKDMVLVSGFNVYPTEVESVLYGHPDVVECAVIGIPDEKCGEAVKAFVVSRNPELSEEELRSHCRDELTAYKIPREVAFVDALPKSAVGKILRRELRDSL